MKKNKISFEKIIISRINDLSSIKGGNGPSGDGNNTTRPQAPKGGKILKCINNSNDWVEVDAPGGQGTQNN